MKRKVIIPVRILNVILAIAFLFSYSIFNRKLQEANQKLSQLTCELENLKEQVSTQNQDITVHMQTLADAIILVQTEGRDRAFEVDEYLKSLHDGLEHSTRDFSKKYSTLHLDFQTPAPSPAVIEETIIPSAVSIPGEAHRESLLLHDVRLSKLYNTGSEAFKKKKYSQAKNIFAELLDYDPPLYEAHLYYIKAVYTENPGRAATDKTVKRLLHSLPRDMHETGQVSKYKGLLALETEDYEQGISLIEESLEKNPEDKKLRLLLGECYLYLKQQEKANLVFQEIISLFPDTPESGEATIYLEKSREAG